MNDSQGAEISTGDTVVWLTSGGIHLVEGLSADRVKILCWLNGQKRFHTRYVHPHKVTVVS